MSARVEPVRSKILTCFPFLINLSENWSGSPLRELPLQFPNESNKLKGTKASIEIYNEMRSVNTERFFSMLQKCTTRHIRIFAAEVENNELVPSDRVLTLDVDPDNEFNWDDVALQKVYRKFDELVESYNGEALTDYNLRRIGSDLEHVIRAMLQNSEISYNLDARVLNYSMGIPQVVAKNG